KKVHYARTRDGSVHPGPNETDFMFFGLVGLSFGGPTTSMLKYKIFYLKKGIAN
ncbi:31884_t:CDS:1, partial [Gigaspora margarita]